MVIHGTQPLQRNRTEPLTLDNLPLVHQSAKIQPDSISSVPTLKGESTWKGPVSAERVVICFAFKRLAVCCFFTPVVFDKVVANRKAFLLSLLKTEYIYIILYYIILYYIILYYIILYYIILYYIILYYIILYYIILYYIIYYIILYYIILYYIILYYIILYYIILYYIILLYCIAFCSSLRQSQQQ